MKLRILSLYTIVLAVFCTQVKASHPIFGFAPPPPSSSMTGNGQTAAPADEKPFETATQSIHHEEEGIHHPAFVENPFAAPTTPESISVPAHEESMHQEEHPAMPENPFAPVTTESAHHEETQHEMTAPTNFHEHNEPTMHPEHMMTTPHTQEHMPTAVRATSIPTLSIVPGHSAILAPLIGSEASMHYFIQDKNYNSYLTTTLTHGNIQQILTIPATAQKGSFTVFKVQGIGVHPQSLQPAYHVTINSLEIEGTQFPEEQTSSALEKLKNLEEKYLTDMQNQFKVFMKEVRTVLNEAMKTGESLASTKPALLEKLTTHPPLSLSVGETNHLTTFAGGSAQSADPAIATVTLAFKGTKEKPEWTVSLTAHKAGETTVTYSNGIETFEQPIFVKGETVSEKTMTPEETHSLKEKTQEKVSVLPARPADLAQEHEIPLTQEGAVASLIQAQEKLPGEEETEQKEQAVKSITATQESPEETATEDLPGGEEADTTETASTTSTEPHAYDMTKENEESTEVDSSAEEHESSKDNEEDNEEDGEEK